MAHTNVGALDRNQKDIPTKKALKDMLNSDPASVQLYSTASGFDGDTSTTGDNLTPGLVYDVCGPNPYTSRKWYAAVELKNGKITVK